MFDLIKNNIFFEESSLEKAKQGNRCLNEPFKIEKNKLDAFWSDYDKGMSVRDLNKKYCAKTFRLPKHLWLKRIYHKYKWIFKK
ncbi:MAG TPA: hypothetical protein GX010_03680 [Erysipelotrichaceae bacterium]|nr:hypothetical protein [Erysipelotrichaceae bacterium]